MRDRCRFSFRKFFGWGVVLSLALVGGAFGESPAAEPGRVSFPTYGISFVVPAGWIVNPCPMVPGVIALVQLDKDQHIASELTIQANETQPFERHKLDEFALARNAEVLVQPFTVDGAPATAIRKNHRDDSSGTFLLLVANHDTRSYSFSIASPGDDVQTHDLITLVKSVHWIPVEDPLDHLQQLQTAPVFGNGATIQIPTLFRIAPGGRQKNFAAFMITDAASKEVAAISFSFVPADADNPGIPNDDQLLVFRRGMLEKAQKRWGMSDFPLMDVKTPITHGIATTPTIVNSVSGDAHMVKAYSRFCAIFAKEGVTYVELQSLGDPGDQSAKWDKVLLGIANSLTFGGESAIQPAGR